MALEAIVWKIANHTRSQIVAQAMAAGIKRIGDRVSTIYAHTFTDPVGDLAVFYGYTQQTPYIMERYKAAGKRVVYVDLGYWGRLAGGKLYGHHKISVDDRHPTAYFQRRKMDRQRIAKFQIAPQPWRKGSRILVAGMGDKAAQAEGLQVEQFEREAIRVLQEITERWIVYRPKPSWKGARPIGGVLYSAPSTDLAAAMLDCHAVVTHHSNVAVDALVQGIPCFCWKGVAAPLSLNDLSLIEQPLYPDGREQWMADIAYTQWTVAEMHQGLPWKHLKDEGLI